MKLRNYRHEDCEKLIRLFYETVHTVNQRDYNEKQLFARAPEQIDPAPWAKSLAEHDTVVAEINGVLVGFGDLAQNGYLDRLFVHKDFQGKGIASGIVSELERRAGKCGINRITTEASITAKPFFEHIGYRVLKKQNKFCRGEYFINYIMEKILMVKDEKEV